MKRLFLLLLLSLGLTSISYALTDSQRNALFGNRPAAQPATQTARPAAMLPVPAPAPAPAPSSGNDIDCTSSY